METQAHMKMAQIEFQEEKPKEAVEEITEDQFLKDLYLFMKKRDTPIERIPHLGFKQIDLFVMFKTVNDLGGYHQVTAQQLWKQVYNTLGGNPRSTSAATCTRRHYEKLLLPYECHMKGISIRSVLPHHQSKPFHFTGCSEIDDGQRPPKRRMITIPEHQNPRNLPIDQHRSLFPLPLHYPPYYHPSHTALPPYIPIPPSMLPTQCPPAPKPQFPYSPPCLNSPVSVKEPLKQLRYLAEQYKTSSGLAEPLNLSVKASAQETSINPVSSFSPPNPKFLNKPSTLYTHHHAGVLTKEGHETQDGESSEGVTPSPLTMKAQDAHIIDDNIVIPSSSPRYGSALSLGIDNDPAGLAQKPSSPKIDLTAEPKEETKGKPEVMGLNLSQILPSLPQEKDGKMEIEIPLSMFHKLFKMCQTSAMMHESKALLPTQEQYSEQRNWPNTDTFPTNMTFHMNPQHQNSALSLRNVPNLTQMNGSHNTSQNNFMSSKPFPSADILKNAASEDVLPYDQQDINKLCNSKSSNSWHAHERATQSSPIEVESDSSPPREQDFAYKFYNDVQGGKQNKEMGSPAVLMVNSSSTSLLQLTTEEIMKLKKIISSSS